jgi:hypothetical protein
MATLKILCQSLARSLLTQSQSQVAYVFSGVNNSQKHDPKGLASWTLVRGREMMAWLTHLQHIREKNVIFVGILDEVTDDYGRKQYALQIEGSKTGRELPGIVDEVITMAVMAGDNGPYRAFVCGALNEWGYPAKDRSGRLDTLEEPHLGKLMAKMSVGPLQSERPLDFVNPNAQNSSEGEVANA